MPVRTREHKETSRKGSYRERCSRCGSPLVKTNLSQDNLRARGLYCPKCKTFVYAGGYKQQGEGKK